MKFGVRIIDVLAGAYRDVVENWCIWLKIILAPILVMVAVDLVVPITSNWLTATDQDSFPRPEFLGLALIVIGPIISFVFSMMLYVNMYRYALLGEYKNTWLNFRFDRPLFRTIGYILVFVLAAFVGGALVLGSFMLFENELFTLAFTIIAVLAAVYLLVRFCFAVPAAATDVAKPFRASYELTQGQSLLVFFSAFSIFASYFAFLIFLALPFIAVGLVLSPIFMVHEGLANGIVAVLGAVYIFAGYAFLTAASGKWLTNLYVECKKGK